MIKVQFRPGALEPALHERAGTDPISVIVARDLERYYHMLTLSVPAFSEDEAALLVRVVHPIPSALSTYVLWAAVADAIEGAEGGAIEQRGSMSQLIDIDALVRRLRSLSPFEALAVADAVERWHASYSHEPLASGLRAVGLVKDTRPALLPMRMPQRDGPSR